MLQLLRDLEILTGGVDFDIEQLVVRIAAFEQPAPHTPEWYQLYDYALIVLDRVDAVDSEAFRRVSQFVRENEDLAMKTVLRG